MRKLLLATAAVVGASMGVASFATAQAQTVYPLAGTVVSPRNAGHASTYGNNNYLNGTATKGPVANPTPGTMVVHLGFLVLSEGVAGWSSADVHTNTAPFSATNPEGTNKVNPISFQTYMRIYPGVDAMAANGMRYGAAVELRQNFFGNPLGTPQTGSPGVQPGASGGTTESLSQTVFVRREFVYVGADNLGVVRFGETDGVIGTFDQGGATTGVFLSPSGTIVGGDLQGSTVGGWMAPYFGAQSGNEYATEKLFYDSPSFFGFDFAAQYSPHPFNGFGMAGGCLVGVPTCTNISSSAASGSVQTNIYAAGVRYHGTIGPAAILAYGLYMGSGHVNYTGTLTGPGTHFNSLGLYMFGANVAVGGLQVFGNVMHGAFNGVLGLKPEGAPNATGLGAGAKYAIGPFTIGGVYSQYDSQGNIADTGKGQNHSWVAYMAATYTAAPGLTFYADYGYGHTHQGGTVAAGDGQTQAFLLGTAVTW